MDWMKEGQEMFKSWTDVQTKAWTGWLDAAKSVDASNPSQLWQASVDAWQESVKGTLEAQAEGSRIWAEGLATVQMAPKETIDWARQAQEMTKQWSETQQQMWDNWFEMVKKTDPGKLAGNWPNMDGQNVLKVWQDMAQKAIDSQAEWVRGLASMGQTKK